MTVNDQGSFEPELEPLAVEAVKPRARSSRLLNVALGAALAVAIAGVAFAVGRGTAPASAATGPIFANGAVPGGGTATGPGPGGITRGLTGGPSIEGTVTAIDADSVTIKMADGTTIELSTDDSTEYHQQAAAEASDVTTGTKVVVQVLRPGRARRPQGGAKGSPAPSASAGSTSGTATDITVVP